MSCGTRVRMYPSRRSWPGPPLVQVAILGRHMGTLGPCPPHLGARRAILKTDSQLVALQVEKSYQAHGSEMKKYLEAIQACERRFKGFSVQHIPQVENTEADELAKMAA